MGDEEKAGLGANMRLSLDADTEDCLGSSLRSRLRLNLRPGLVPWLDVDLDASLESSLWDEFINEG